MYASKPITINFTFVCLPDAAIWQHISAHAKILYAALLSYRNRKTGMCNPKLITLAERLGKSERTIRRALDQLRRAGMVLVHRSLCGNRYELTTQDQWHDVSFRPNVADAERPTVSARSGQMCPIRGDTSLYEPDLNIEPEIAAAADVPTTPGGRAAAATPVSVKSKPEKPTPTPPAPEPTFEERYGPWICAGCGKPHKLGDACPGDEPAADRQAEKTEKGSDPKNFPGDFFSTRPIAEQIAVELMAVHPEPGNLPNAISEVAKILSSTPGEVAPTLTSIRASHASWRVRWAEFPKGRFIPQLARWFRDGDWRNPPVQRKGIQSETWIERRDREYTESQEKTYRMYAENEMWDALRECGQDVEEWRGKVEAIA